MNETNRTVIILLAALWIILMAVIIYLAWADPAGTADELKDFAQYLDDHRDTGERLILTLAALVLAVLALLVIIVELAPEEETREIRVEQAGATTIVPAAPLQQRLEEALTAMAHVSAARTRVFSHHKGIGLRLDLTVTPDANIAVVRQEASRVVVEALQADLGLPVSGPPSVRIAFGPRPVGEPVASSVTQPPAEGPVGSSLAQPPAPEPPQAAAPSPPAVGPAPETPSPADEGPSEPAPPPPSAREEPPATERSPQDETQQQ